MASSTHLYLAATTACLTASLFGYSVGFIGGVLALPSFLAHFDLTKLPASELASVQARIVTLWLFGALFGVPLGMPVCSRWGRKRCLIFSAGLYVLGAALQLVRVDGEGPNALRLFELGRALNGLGVGAGTLVSPMYISEVSPPSKRGMLMSGYQTVLQISALVGFWGAFICHSIYPDTSKLQWQIPVAIQLVPGALLLVGTFFIPETPRYLVSKRLFEEANSALAWLRGVSNDDADVKQEMDEMREAIDASESLQLKKPSFFREAATKPVRKRLFVGVGIMIAQNIVGLNAINYYAPSIFVSAGFTSVSASLFLSGVFGIIKLLSAIAFMFVFVRIKGNRFWLKLGTGVCCIAMLVLAYSVKIMAPPDHSHQSGLTIGGVISVIMVYIFTFFFGVSLGPISWNVCSEIFPIHINAKCCVITTSVQWLFQIVIASMTPHLLASIGWATYLVYAVFCALSFLWVSAFVPETRGVKLGRPMDALFDQDLKGDDSQEAGVVETEEVLETSPLLRRDRRGSVAAYT